MLEKPPLHPVTWQPPSVAPRPRIRPLPVLEVIEVPGTGPEDVVVDAQGRVLTGLADGRILRLSADGQLIETLGNTRGRPLGIELFAEGALLICDAKRGLLRMLPDTGEITLLLDQVEGERMRFCNNAAIARDGTIYFSDSSRNFGIEHWRGDLLEHSATGRLLRRSPDGRVEVLLDGLAFANGVALAADESFVAVAETGGYCVNRYWLSGPRAGTRDVLIDGLAGFPDNIALGSDGLIWITQASPRNPLLDKLLPVAPALRKVVWKLPDWVQPPGRTVWVVAVDAAGRVVHDIQGQHPSFHMVTGVREHRGSVYLGSLVERAVAKFSLK